MNIALIYLYRIIYRVCVFTVTVRYSNRKSNEYCTNLLIQDYLWRLSIHCYSLLFSWQARFLNRVE